MILTTRAELLAHQEHMDALRAQFLREWEAENRDLPESTAKALKMLRDWQHFLNTKGYRAIDGGQAVTTKELRELDAWIAEHVMGAAPEIIFDLKDSRTNLSTLQFESKKDADGFLERYIATKGEGAEFRYVAERRIYQHYTTDSSYAMEVLKKCAVGSPFTHITKLGDKWITYRGADEGFSDRVEAETLELAICLFAKKLFGGTNA